MRILIAEASRELREQLTQALSGTYRVRSCEDGLTALKETESFEPDLLLIDMMLPQLDGLSVLQNLYASGNMPTVLVTTGFAGEYLLDSLRLLGVADVILKPYTVSAILCRIWDMLTGAQMFGQENDRMQINRILFSLGLRANLTGFRYVTEAIVLLMQDPEQMLTKQLYPSVARRFGGTWQQAERVIRLCIRDAWQQRNREIWRLYFGAERTQAGQGISNSHFLTVIAGYLRNQPVCDADGQAVS